MAPCEFLTPVLLAGLLCKKDKGAAITLVYKEVSWKHPLIKNDTSILLAANSTTKKKLLHMKYKRNSNDATVTLPLDCVLQHSEVKLHHNLIDGNIALCSPSVLPLFSDNFDFQTRHDFIHGILINEAILASSLYYTLIKGNQYAAAVTKWKTYQTICWDILHNYWVHPLSIETGMLQRNTFLLSENSVARKFDCKLSRSSVMENNNVIGQNTIIGDLTIIEQSDIGNNCIIGRKCNIKGCHIGNNTVIGDYTILEQSEIGNNCRIGSNCNIKGCQIMNNDQVKDSCTLNNCFINDNCIVGKNCNLKGVLAASDSRVTSQNTLKAAVLDEADKATNVFLQEVIDSLARRYEEKLNEDILASSLYYTLIKGNQYAAAVTNWKTYQTKWSSVMENNVIIGMNSLVGDFTILEQSDFGNNCIIGSNCNIKGCHMMNNVIVKDNLTLKNCFFDNNSIVDKNCNLEGVLAASDSRVTSQNTLKGAVLDEADKATNGKTLLKSASDGTEWGNESSGDDDEFIGFEKVWSDSESCYSSDSSVDSLMPGSHVPDVTNIFLQEVIDSLARGYEEKLKCDYLILEINSSRYAYNIQLHEVNFFVIRAMLSMPMLINSKSVLSTVKDILKYFRPVLANYIKTKPSIMDCLKAIEESCLKNEWLNGKSGQVIHLFYEMDVVDEDSMLEWQNDMQEDESPLCKEASLVKFFEWLQQTSEESEESD